MNEMIEKATQAAWEELRRQQPREEPTDLSDSHGLPPLTLVLSYDGFDLRAVIVAAIKASDEEAVQVPKWALKYILGYGMFQDEGPVPEGWCSPKMEEALKILRKHVEE